MKNKICLILVMMSLVLIVAGCGNTNVKKHDNNLEVQKNEKQDEKKSKITEVHTGDMLKTDNYEISLKTLEFKSELKYRVSEYYTKSVTIDNGKKAFALSGIFKNLMGEKIDEFYAIKCKVVIDDKYKYDGSFKAWQDLEPLVESPFVLYAQVPDSVVNSYNKVELIFGFNNDFKSDYNSDVEKLDNVFSIVLKK